MNLLERLKFLAKAALNDLTSENNETGPGDLSTLSQSRFLAEATAQSQGLKAELVEAIALGKRQELEWQRHKALIVEKDAAVTRALQAGQDAQARQLLAEMKNMQAEADRLEGRASESAEMISRMQAILNEYDTRLEIVRRQMQDLAEKEHNATKLEDTERLRRSLRQEISVLQSSLDLRHEMVARRQDKLAARKDIDQRDTPE